MTRLTLATIAVVAIAVVARRARVRDEVEDDAGDLRERALRTGDDPALNYLARVEAMNPSPNLLRAIAEERRRRLAELIERENW